MAQRPAPASPTRAVRAVVEIALFVVLMGGPDGAIGVVWPSMAAELRRPAGDLGVLALAGMAPYMLASATSGAVIRRRGAGPYIAVAAVIGTAGLAAWAWSPVWGVAVAAFVVINVGAGALDAGLNAQVAAEHGVGRLGLLHAMYGVGATGGPALATAVLVAGWTWRVVAVSLLAATAVAALAAVLLRNDWPRVTTDVDGDVDVDGRPAPNRALSRPVVAATLSLFFLYVAFEAVVGFWSFLFLRERGLSAGAAGTWATLFWGALTAGRFALAAVGSRVRPAVLLHGGCAVALLGAVVMWLDPAGLGPAGVPIVGLGLSPVFPVLVAVMPERVGRNAAPTVIGWSVAAASVGGPVAVWVFGQLGERAGMASLGPAFAAAAALVLGLEALAGALARR